MKSIKYDYWVKINEITPPMDKKKFAATAEIHDIGGGKVEHDLGEIWGETREDAHKKMTELIRQWIRVNEK